VRFILFLIPVHLFLQVVHRNHLVAEQILFVCGFLIVKVRRQSAALCGVSIWVQGSRETLTLDKRLTKLADEVLGGNFNHLLVGFDDLRALVVL